MYVLAILSVVFSSWSYQSDVALNLYDFIVRRPNKLTEKYGLRAYDEIILAPMVGLIPFSLDFSSYISSWICSVFLSHV